MLLNLQVIARFPCSFLFSALFLFSVPNLPHNSVKG